MRRVVTAALATLGLVATGAAARETRALETITVSNTDPKPVQSATVLDQKHRYRITASGTISDWCPPTATKPEHCSLGSPLAIGQGVDAIYCYAAWHSCSKPKLALWRQLRVNGRGLDEIAGKAGSIPYSPSHVYTVEVKGISGRLSLVAWDAAAGSTSDNSGAFTVELADLGPVKDQLGVGFVPFLNAGDETEQTMHSLVGSFSDIDLLFNPGTPEQLFDTLLKLKRSRKGKLIDYVVIGGHGSKENPRIQLSQGDLDPASVDLPFLRQRVEVFERAIARGKKLTAAQRQELASTRARLRYLESVSSAMAAGAGVLLVNCSPAATANGQRFLQNLGEVLLGKRGGVLVASRRDVTLGQVRSLANKIRVLYESGEVVEIGEFFVAGDWVRIPVAPRAR